MGFFHGVNVASEHTFCSFTSDRIFFFLVPVHEQATHFPTVTALYRLHRGGSAISTVLGCIERFHRVVFWWLGNASRDDQSQHCGNLWTR